MDLSLKYIDSKCQFHAIPLIAIDAYDFLASSKINPDVSRFILIRHGESESNAEKSIAGRTNDVDLTEKGKEQASRAGAKLLQTMIPIHAVYCSPSKRAKNTASLFFNPLNFKIDERLYEKFYGPFEGASEDQYRMVKELEERENTGPHKSFNEKFRFKAHPAMESMDDIHGRVSSFFREKHTHYRGKNVIVATHNGILKAFFMDSALKLGIDVDYRSFIVNNASLLILEVDDLGIQAKASTGFTFLF